VEIRTFRPGLEEAVVSLWNRCVRGCYATGPLDVESFAASVLAKKYYDPDGLLVAFDQGRPVAFVHAGFKSSDWIQPDCRMGTLSMVAVEEDYLKDGEATVAEAVRYLFRRGAKQVEAFTIDFPRTPFYNGLYGGELAGMDEEHSRGLELMRRCRFNISNGALIMVCELADEAAFVPPAEGLQLRIGDWQSPLLGRSPAECYGIPEPVRRASLVNLDGEEKGGITFWQLDRYNRASGDHLAVVSHVGVAPELQGTGAAVWLQQEVHKILRGEGAERVGLGTGASNGRAVSFYRKLGYQPLKTAYSFHLDWRRYGDFA